MNKIRDKKKKLHIFTKTNRRHSNKRRREAIRGEKKHDTLYK